MHIKNRKQKEYHVISARVILILCLVLVPLTALINAQISRAEFSRFWISLYRLKDKYEDVRHEVLGLLEDIYTFTFVRPVQGLSVIALKPGYTQVFPRLLVVVYIGLFIHFLQEPAVSPEFT